MSVMDRIHHLERDAARLDAVEKGGWTIIGYRDGRAVVCSFDTREGHYWGKNVREAIDNAIKAQTETPTQK